jgi:hypothetical protein
MAELLYPHVARDDTLVVSDNGGANTYPIDKWPGDFTSDSPMYAITDILNNGEHDCPRRGAAQVQTLGWSVHLRGVGSAAEANMPDICRWQDAPGLTYVDANWVSTLTGKSDVLAADVARTLDGAWAGVADKTELYTDVRLRGSHTSGDPSVYAVTGTTATLTPTYS